MIKKLYLLVFAAFIALPFSSYATVRKVTTLADGGAGSLRALIGAATAGDTILMDVKGTIVLTSALSITTPVRIIGAYPVHNTIDVSSYQISINTPTDTTHVQGFTITRSVPGAPGSGVFVAAGSMMQIKECVLRDIEDTTTSGGALFIAGRAEVIGCTFMNNSTTGLLSAGGGGAVYISNSSYGSFINCTFANNTNSSILSSSGGAIATDGTTNLTHCTFYNNNNYSLLSSGDEIYSSLGTAIINLKNNLFYSSPALGSEFGSSGGSWTSLGGNVFTFLPATFTPIAGVDLVTSSTAINLSATTDGYGLFYYRLVTPSAAIDYGVTTGVLPASDCRRAPRTLYGTTVLKPDAGAVEYTPFTVSSATLFATAWSNMNASPAAGPRYMDFDASAPATQSVTASLPSANASGRIWIVDGYSRAGSAVPAPGLSAATVTPAVYAVTLTFSPGGPNMFADINSTLAGSFISGIKINTTTTGAQGITNTDGNLAIFGCGFTSPGGQGEYAVKVQGYTSNVNIGGPFHFQRNIIGGQNASPTASGIVLDGIGGELLVQGNFIGTDPTGMITDPNKNGVWGTGIYPSKSLIGGNINLPSRNLISTNYTNQLYFDGIENVTMRGNLIGTNVTGNSLLSATPLSDGIHLLRNYSCTIGGNADGEGNIIVNQNHGTYSNMPGPGNVYINNYYGISANGAFVMPNTTGAHVSDADAGSGSAFTGNTICASTNMGIYLDATQYNVTNNSIGIMPGGAASGNGLYGIHVVNNANGSISGNMISDHITAGIQYTSGGPVFILNNKIGTDLAGLTAMANGTGIYMDNPTDTYIRGNLVSGNTTAGIDIANASGTTPVKIVNNIIGLNASQTAALGNQYGIKANLSDSLTIDSCIVAGNSSHGIDVLGCNSFDIRHSFIGVSSALTAFGNGGRGVSVSGTSTGWVGFNMSDKNIIAGNGQDGVWIGKESKETGINCNSIYSNTGLGISLDNGGVPLPNDLTDTDISGSLAANKGNNGQNYPDSLKVITCGANTNISGRVSVDNPSATYRIEVYSIPPGGGDASLHGEGNTFVAMSNYVPGSTLMAWGMSITGTFPPGTLFTTTCSKQVGGKYETSEFSKYVPITTFDATLTTTNVICNGAADGSATVSVTGATPVLYQWFNMSGPIGGYISPTSGPLAAGDYYAEVTEYAGCVLRTDTVTITEPLAIDPNLVVIQQACANVNDAAITSTPLNGTGPYNFEWVNSFGTFATETGLTSSVTGLAPDTYQLTVTDNNGCVINATEIINPGLNVTASFTGGGTVCEGSPVSFTDASTVAPGPSTITAWHWAFGDGGVSAVQNPTYTYASSGAFNIELIATSGVCMDTLTVPITVSEGPTISDFGNQVECEFPAIMLTSVVSGSGSEVIDWFTSSGANVFNTPPGNDTVQYLYSGATTDTIYLAVQDGACIVSDTMVLTIDQQPTVILPGNFTVCAGPVTGLVGSATNAGSIAWTSNGTGTFTAPGALTTDYDASGDGGNTVDIVLNITSVQGACPAVSDTLELTVSSPPTISAGLNFPICFSDGSFSLSGSTSASGAVEWEILGSAAGSLSSTSTLTTTYTMGAGDEGTAVHFIFTASETGCADVTDTITVTIDGVPVVTAGTGMTICAGSTAAVNAVTTYSPGITWTHNGAGTYDNPALFNPVYTSAAADGGATLELIATTGVNGTCPATSDTVEIVVAAGPVPEAGTNFAICYNANSITLNGTSSSGTAAIQWYGLGTGGTLAPAAGSLTPTYTFGTTDEGSTVKFVLELVETGCPAATDTIFVTIDGVPAVTAGTSTSICTGSTVTATAVVDFSAGITWTHNGSGTYDDPALLNPTYSPVTADAGNIVELVATTDVNGTCPATSDTVEITVLESTVADAGANDAICVGSNYGLDATASTGAIIAYQWMQMGTGIIVGTAPTATVTPTVTTSYILTITNGTCNDTDTITITVNPLGDATFSYPATAFCANADSVQVTAATTGTYSDVSPGGANVNINAATGTIYPANSIVGGPYTIEHTTTGACPNTATFSITILDTPAVNFVPDYSACFADTVQFSATPAGGVFSGTATNVTGLMHTLFAGTGPHIISYSYTSAATGCTSVDTNRIVVQALPAVSFTGLSGPYCPADGPVPLTGIPAGGVFFLNGAIQSSPYSYDPAVPGTDSIAYGYISPVTGCGNFDYELVVVSSGPATPVLASAAPYDYCGSSPQSITVTNPATTVQWYPDASLATPFASGTTISSGQLPSGSGTIYIVNSSGATCTSAPLAVAYNHYDGAGIALGGPYETCAGEAVTLELTLPAGVTHAWEADPALSDASALKPVATAQHTSIYVVNVTYTALPTCVITDSVAVTVTACSLEHIANAFTPDGDGVNDTWIINGITGHPENEVVIFNRWGDKLQDFKNYDNAAVIWNGTYNGTLVAAGTYYFTIRYFDDGQERSGWIQVNY